MEVKMFKNLFCEICSLQFDKKIVYDIHMSFVHKMEQSKSLKKVEAMIKEKECSICKKSFSTKYTIKNHIEAYHLEDICVPCGICENTFKTRAALKLHIRHHA